MASTERGNMNNEKNTTTVFISYAREDFEKAKRLYEELKLAGLNPWLDDKSLRAGEKWKMAIEETIKNSRYFVVLFSTNLQNKKNTFVHKEVQHAISLMNRYDESHIFILPLRLDSCEIRYNELRDLHRIDLFPKWEKGLKKLLNAMEVNLDIKKGIIENQFNNSNIEQAYARALACISSLKYSRIKDKETNLFIMASLGSQLGPRTIGYALSDPRWLRIDVFINFLDRKITISDASGFGLRWPAGAKIIKNMREIATIIKEKIEEG